MHSLILSILSCGPFVRGCRATPCIPADRVVSSVQKCRHALFRCKIPWCGRQSSIVPLGPYFTGPLFLIYSFQRQRTTGPFKLLMFATMRYRKGSVLYQLASACEGASFGLNVQKDESGLEAASLSPCSDPSQKSALNRMVSWICEETSVFVTTILDQNH